MWRILIRNWDHFYWLTGEIPPTFQLLMDEIRDHIPIRVVGRNTVLNIENQVLLCLVWLRRYPTLSHISMQFGIPVSCTHRIVHKILPILHAAIVNKYIKWPSPQKWTRLAGTIPEWPHVVGILDGTPFRISRPAG